MATGRLNQQNTTGGVGRLNQENKASTLEKAGGVLKNTLSGMFKPWTPIDLTKPKTLEKTYDLMENAFSRVSDALSQTPLFKGAGEGLVAIEQEGDTKGSVLPNIAPELLKRLSLFKKPTDQDLDIPVPTQPKTFLDEIKEVPNDPYKLVPFLSSVRELPQTVDLYRAAKNLDNNKGETREEKRQLLLLQRYVEENERESTLGAKVVDILTNLPSFAGELVATSGISGMGRIAAKNAIKETIDKVVGMEGKKLLSSKLAQLGLKTAEVIAGETVRAPIAGITRIANQTIENQIPTLGLERNEQGQLRAFIAEEADQLPEAFAKAFTDQWIEVVSERAGGILPDITKPVRDKVLKFGVFSALKKLNPSLSVQPFRDFIKKTGWNGVLQEVFEERAGEVMRGLATEIGLSDQGWVMPSKEQILAEFIAFAIPGAGIATIDTVLTAGRRNTPTSTRMLPKPFITNPIARLEEMERNAQSEDLKKEIGDALNYINSDVSEFDKRTEAQNYLNLFENRVRQESKEQFQVENFETNKQFITTEQAFEQIKQIPFLRNVDIETVPFIRTPDGRAAFGSYVDGLIKFVENPKETTLPHEAAHAFFDLALDQSEKESILTEVKDLFPTEVMDDIKASEKLSEITQEWFVADKAGKEEIVSRFKTIESQKPLIRRILDKIVKFFKQITKTENIDSIKRFLEVITTEEGAKRVSENKEAVQSLREEMFQSEDGYTLKFFKHKDLKSRKTASYEYLQNLIKNANPKKGERIILEKTLELPKFKDNKNIDIEDFLNETKTELLILNPISTNTYADYGLSNIGVSDVSLSSTPSIYDSSAQTVIINTDFKHGVKGHFSNAFDVTTTKDDIEIREIKAGTYEVQGETRSVPKDQFAVVRKDVRNEDGLFGVFATQKEAEDYVANFAQRTIKEAGMLSHYRAFNQGDTYSVVEIQSDVFQKDLTPLLRSNEQLALQEIRSLESKIEADESVLITLRDFDPGKAALEKRINNNKILLEKFKNNQIEDLQKEGYFFRRKYIGSIERIKSSLIRLKPEVSEKTSFVQLYDDVRGEALEVKQAIITAGSPDALFEDVKRLVEIDDLVRATRSEPMTDEKIKNKLVEYRTEVKKTAEYALKFLQDLSDNLTESQLKEIEKSKKFIDLRNIWHEITIKQAIREAANFGMGKVRFASDYTVANVEGYIDTTGNFGEGMYSVNQINHLGVGGIVEIGEAQAIITSIDSDSYEAIWSEDKIEIMTPEQIRQKYSLKEDQDVVEYLEDEFGNYYDMSRDDIEEYAFVPTGAALESETLAYKTSFDGDAESFVLEDILNEDHRTIAKKYSADGIYTKYLKKIRPDLRQVTDENGFTWWETTISPEDKGAIEMYQLAEEGPIRERDRALRAVKNSERFDNAFLELNFTIENSQVFLSPAPDPRFSGQMIRVSTYPKWVPEHLRNRKLMEKVFDLIDKNEIPAERATKQLELFDIFVRHLAERTGTSLKLPKIKQFKNPSEMKSMVEAAVASGTLTVEDKKLLQQELQEQEPEKVADLQPSQIPVQTGEVMTLEELANQLQEADPLSVDSNAFPLKKIIVDTSTPVKNKVNLLDYIRTPDRVMQKIGLYKESQFLISQYDGYLKELPQNIDVITKWANKVRELSPDPDASNMRIFRWLDGRLSDSAVEKFELDIAIEIKDYFEFWANRLGLPVEDRIDKYITHIFSDQLIQKEFDEDLAKIIADKIPGSVYDPFLQKRLGKLGFREDTWAALDAYVKRATRKIYMDPALEIIEEKASTFEESQWNYVKRYLDRVNLRPTELDNLLDNMLKNISFVGYRLGQRPVTAIARILRQFTYRGTLGLNIGSAVRNLSQGINTYAVLGTKWTTIGYAGLFKKGAIQELKDEGVLNNAFIQDRTLSAMGRRLQQLDEYLWLMFETAERINRGSAYFGAKAKAISEGMAEGEAIRYAKDIVRKTQFTFGSVDMPVGISSDVAKTFTQLLNFSLKQTEFLIELAKDKNFMGLLRYALFGFIFLNTIGRLFGMKPEELLPSFRFGVPPSLQFPWEVTKAALNAPDKFGNQRTLEQKFSDIGKSFLSLVPGGIQAKKTLEGYEAWREGGSFDKAGKLQFTVATNPIDAFKLMVFGKYATPQAESYFNKVEDARSAKKKLMPTYNKIKELAKSGDLDTARDAYESLSTKEKEVFKAIKSDEKAEETLKGKKNILPTFVKIRDLVVANKKDEAKEIYNQLSEDEQRYFDLVKKDFEKQQKAEAGEEVSWEDGDVTTEKSLIELVSLYAKALVLDPEDAFKTMFTREQLEYVANNSLIMVRLPFTESNKIKEQQMIEAGIDLDQKGEYRLDHIIPRQLGGDNSENNLKLVPRSLHESYTPVENYIGVLLRSGKIKEAKAQELILQFKNGLLTAEQIYQIK